MSKDQRWLCYAVGGWQMLDCLIDPAFGISRLMQSMSGSSNGQRDGEGPDWLREGFRCAYGTITTGMFYSRDHHGDVVVTTAELTAFAASLPANLIADMKHCRHASQSMAVARWDWCNCGRDCGRERRHYTPAEYREELDLRHHTRREEKRLLRIAFGIDAMAEPDDLLDLLALTDH
ncbi:MAG: hypothetical protein C0482_16155 [Gordonia sp.]|nr:hypothetical protein [Gordonia sp. (in: high G+C Gram-positive bacteria)]